MTKRLLSLLLTLFIAAGAVAADWPAYRADASRSGVSSEKLNYPLSQAWQYLPDQRPRPAWPEPGRHMNRMDFDYASQPVIAGGLVFIASSADDTVRGLDTRSGAERWRFTARGPVRFAPHIADGRCYFAADDGFAYCLEAATGKLVWESRLGLNERLFVGDDRMISRWPCRSGILVADGTAYVTAGMWPSEGVYLYALDAATGKVRWCNDTSASLYLPHPHASSSFGGPAPQGYLVLTKDVLLVPTGQSSPAGIDPKTGRLLYCNIISGSSSVTVAGNVFFTYQVKQTTEDHDIIQIGENGPGEGDGMLALDLATGSMPNKGGLRYGLSGRENVLFHDKKLYAVGSGVVEALDFSGEGDRRKLWTANQGRAYSMVLAGDVLLIGGAGEIAAFNAADGKSVWQKAIKGQVRGLAVANGQLFAATEDGALTCFAANGQNNSGQPTTQAGKSKPAPAPAPAALSRVLKGIQQPASFKGYALIVGEPDAKLAEALARETQMHVISVLPGKAAAGERNRLLQETSLYGSRLAICELDKPSALPFADYFANLVVVSGSAGGIPAGELYRVLHPCGGRLACLGESATFASALKQAGVPDSEIAATSEGISVARGKLPGAYDWNSEVKCDQRVKWPLEMLWFGGPGPARMVARHWKAPTPVFANGRCFMIGQYHLIGVDAYNGRELWSREVGGNPSYKYFKVTADDSRVYVALTNYTTELDAQSGNILKLYGRPVASPRFSLAAKQSFPLENKGTSYGTVEVAGSPSAIEVVLTSALPISSSKDSWRVNFDFRPLAGQFACEDLGVIRLLIAQTNGSWRAGLGGPVPQLDVKAAGNTTRITIPMNALKELLGAAPASFRFAATLERFPRGQPAVRVHQFADGVATFLNDGWATFVLDEAKAEAADFMPVPVAPVQDIPALAREWPRQPIQFTADWTMDAYDKLEFPQWPPVERESGPSTRLSPFTGLQELLTYNKSHGCGGTIQSVATDFSRSGTIGIYDRLDDSGLRNISAIRPGCGMTLMPAGGIVVSAEGQADCSCSFNFQTSLALAPAARQRGEDWALHDARTVPGLLQGAALNLGAPGDRRDTNGVLWLALPRPSFPTESTSRGKPQREYRGLPCRLEFLDGFGPFHRNAEREPITGTQEPWIFASGARGLKKATLDLVLGQPEDCLAFPTATPPRIDGSLEDKCWNDLAPLVLTEQKAKAFLRSDAENLYVAARLQKDAWPFSLTLRGENGTTMARFTMNADGTAHAARLDNALQIPRAGNISIDGKADDWGNSGVSLPLPSQGVCRFGWTDKGLVMLADLPKSFSAGADLTGMLVLLFRPGSSGFLQCSIDAKAQTASLSNRIRKSPEKPNIRIGRNINGLMHWNRPSGEVVPASPGFRSESTKTDESIRVETLFPWEDLCIEPGKGDNLAFQVAFYDPAKADRDVRPQLLAGSHNQGRVQFVEKAASASNKTSMVQQRSGGSITYQVKADETWAASFVAKAKKENDGGSVEFAIPWKTLAGAGIQKENLQVGFHSSDRWEGTAQEVASEFERSAHRVYWQKPASQVGPYTVKLFFCELDDVKPGERVFDVKLQGKVVLENLDIAKAAGGNHIALSKEFHGILAEKEIALELVPKATQPTERTVPILNAIEVSVDGAQVQ